ncbi:MAG: Crp/Fnr family transcriptional regulator [Bacteroidota bacterium]
MLEKFRKKLLESGPVEDALWQEIQRQAKFLEVKKGEELVQYYSVSTDLFFVLKGSFVVSQITEQGDSKAVWFHFDDVFEYVGSPDSLFSGESTKYEIKALEDGKVIKFPKEVIDVWVKTYPSFNQIFIETIVHDFITIYDARSSLLTYSTLEFLQYTQEKFPFILEKLPAHYIADFLGITPEWYSKLKKKLST